ncbi:MAG: type IV pilus modification PilV family protein [Puniceicoccales bacterium]
MSGFCESQMALFKREIADRPALPFLSKKCYDDEMSRGKIVSSQTTPNKLHLGVTLVEVMVGMVIIAIIFLSTMATMSIGFRASENTRQNAEAQFYLESELEYLRSLDWSELEELRTKYAESKTPLSFLSAAPNDAMSGGLVIGYRDGRTNQMQVVLTTEWTDAKGKTHDANFVTIITDGGVSAL